MRTYSEVSLEKSAAELAAYELTWQDWQAIQQTCRDLLPEIFDGVEHNATRLAEEVAWELVHHDWLDDSTHPVWDAAAHFCTAADSS